MVHEKWFISDTHFFHANILKFVEEDKERTRREYEYNPDHPNISVNSMHEDMIQKWNSVVGSRDYVYHLGDVTFQYNGPFNHLMSRLNGLKRLIVGNHDKIWNPALMKWFEKADLWKGFKESNFTASHMPLREGSFRDGAFNVHGHTHRHVLTDPRYINVCVETRNYTPVHLDTIVEEIKQRSS
jgi:calcineurin-like phosphoesterase family protein